MEPNLLFDRPLEDVREILQTGAPVYLPVNPVEYHGPHLSLHNDSIVSAGLIRDMQDRLAEVHPDWPLLCVRDLGMGVGTAPGPGSQNTPYQEVCRSVLAACRSLADLGAKRVVLMTFHGDPMHNLAVQTGVEWLAKRGVPALAPMHLLLKEMLDPDLNMVKDLLEPIEEPDQRRILEKEIRFDLHAGFLETSLCLHYSPESVRADFPSLPPCPTVIPDALFSKAARVARALGRTALARDLDYIAVGVAWMRLTPHPGYTGSPNLARPEVGRILASLIVETYATAARQVLLEGENPPPTVLSWLPSVTWNGRLVPFVTTG